MNIAVISPHPDDETLGAGGTILKYKEEGEKVYWINVTDVIDTVQWSQEFIEHRKLQIERIRLFYGLDGFYNLRLEATKLDSIERSKVIGKISECIKEIQPQVLILPDPNDAHSDHLCVFESAMACTKVFRCPEIKKILTMEILSETDFGNPYQNFRPNYYVDITKYIDKKVEALKIYDTEIGELPFPRSSSAVRSLAVIRGCTAGVKYAEAFNAIKIIE